jgi:nitric oxide synthase-interacting protein
VDRFEKKERNIMTTKTPKAPAAATSTSTPVGAHAAHLYTDVNARSSQASTSTSIKNTSGEKVAQLPAFWMPMLTPQSEATKLKKPDKTVYCPMTGKQIKMSHLFDVKFTEINDPDEKKSLIAREERYMCPVTHDILNNSTSCVVLKPTGDVVTEECVNNLIKKDMVHPLTGLSLKESDLIYLQRGGTGYAAANTGTLQAKHFRPSMAIA